MEQQHQKAVLLKKPTGRLVLEGLVIGVLAGTFVAMAATWMDWRQNPGNVFYDRSGTHWQAVFETFFSWWWPVVLIVTLLAIVILAWITRHGRPGQGVA
ncbi:MAG TPA: hypothetical protein VKP65_21400 [Rhodothermales bacterium]|nr:hypothetical protein [Rhodothermales bacterium]